MVGQPAICMPPVVSQRSHGFLGGVTRVSQTLRFPQLADTYRAACLASSLAHSWTLPMLHDTSGSAKYCPAPLFLKLHCITVVAEPSSFTVAPKPAAPAVPEHAPASTLFSNGAAVAAAYCTAASLTALLHNSSSAQHKTVSSPYCAPEPLLQPVHGVQPPAVGQV